MSDRPELSKEIDSNTFRTYYYLKEELIDFCRANGVPASGGKLELTDRIAHFLETGEALPTKVVQKPKVSIDVISKDTLIESDFVCSEKHRAFFKTEIGSRFTFNVAFQKWLKGNSGKTYEQAIAAYYEIQQQKKHSKTTIDKQFEYNTYIRDFFENNKDASLADAIKCWKHKKSLPGHNQYEENDLSFLER